MGPTILFGILFNLPKFFEFQGVYRVYNETSVSGEVTEVTKAEYKPTELRLDEDYVFYYVNLTRFFVTGIFPFACLVFLNLSIYR